MIYKIVRQFGGAYKESSLLAISPLDGRYSKSTLGLREYFSEYALFKYRIKVEVEWLKFLFENKIIRCNQDITALDMVHLDDIYLKFDIQAAQRVKEIEKVTNHDVKAIEYYIKEQLDKVSILQQLKEYVHFCCTSEDINNLAYSLILKESKQHFINRTLEELIFKMTHLAEEYSHIPMMGRTHGQAATPTTVGKEFANFVYRIEKQYLLMRDLKFDAKLNGAVGNYNAHYFAYPEIDWFNLSQKFVTEQLQLQFNPYTTQIEPHDSIALYYSYLSLLNTILLGFSRDMWYYISIGYFNQKLKKHETGSSTMPHKINPIDYENAEGNLGMANSIASHFMTKLPISRFQRDLSDSTVMRNHGVALGYSIAGWNSLIKGLDRVEANEVKLYEELEQHWELLAEPIQQVMRKYGVQNAYEQLKDHTRGAKVEKGMIQDFIKQTNLPDDEKLRLLELTPSKYVGNAETMAKSIRKYL